MVGFLIQAAVELVRGHFNEKQLCTKPGCNRYRKGTGDLCEKHQDEYNGRVYLIILLVFIWIVWEVYFNS